MQKKTLRAAKIPEDLTKIPRKNIIIGIILIVVAIFGIKYAIEMPRDLGPKLKYLQTKQTGCPIPIGLGGGLLLCSQELGYKHYFETDMTLDELQNYFLQRGETFSHGTNATIDEYPILTYGGGSKSFSLNYYEDGAVTSKYYDLKSPNKAHIVSITDSSYNAAKFLLR